MNHFDYQKSAFLSLCFLFLGVLVFAAGCSFCATGSGWIIVLGAAMIIGGLGVVLRELLSL